MATRKEDNDDERQARVDAMIEEHRRLIQRADHAQVTVRLAQVRARMAQVLAIESLEPVQQRRVRKRS